MTVTNSEIGAYVDTLSDIGTPASNDELLVYDVSATTTKKVQASALVAGSSGLVLLATQTASASAQLDFTTFISSTYDEYLIEGVGLAPATNGVNLLWRAGTGGGPTYDTAGNYYGSMRTGVGAAANPTQAGSSNGAITNVDSAATSFMIAKTIANNAGYGQVSFSLRLTVPQSTALMKNLYGTAIWHNGTEVFMTLSGALWGSTTAMTAMRFFMSSGNITSGVIRVYGIAK